MLLPSVQDSRRRIWIEAGNQRFGSFVELNAWLAARCRAPQRYAPVTHSSLPKPGRSLGRSRPLMLASGERGVRRTLAEVRAD
jgi:hypothetical protein